MSYCMMGWVIKMKLRIRDLREDRVLPLEYAVKPADFYGVSVDYLLCRTNEKKPYPPK